MKKWLYKSAVCVSSLQGRPLPPRIIPLVIHFYHPRNEAKFEVLERESINWEFPRLHDKEKFSSLISFRKRSFNWSPYYFCVCYQGCLVTIFNRDGYLTYCLSVDLTRDSNTSSIPIRLMWKNFVEHERPNTTNVTKKNIFIRFVLQVRSFAWETLMCWLSTSFSYRVFIELSQTFILQSS